MQLLHVGSVWFTWVLFVFDGGGTKGTILRVAAGVVHMVTVVLDIKSQSASQGFNKRATKRLSSTV